MKTKTNTNIVIDTILTPIFTGTEYEVAKATELNEAAKAALIKEFTISAPSGARKESYGDK